MSEGSLWRKWDLHVHTPASFEHNFKMNKEENKHYKGDVWEKYIAKLEKVRGIAVVGITDYFSIEGYSKIVKQHAEGRLQNLSFILPNIEFRLDKFVEDKRLNFHVLFSPDVDTDKIAKEFLETLDIQTPTGEKRKLTKNNIEEIGASLKAQHKEFKGKSDYWVGCTNITVSLDEIRRALEEKVSLFKGMYLLVLAAEGWDSISWDKQDHLTRKVLLVHSHAIFSGNPNTREWALGLKHASPDEFVAEFGSLKPCLHGSDAHTFDTLCKPAEDRFCWIKADPTFEGLKQVVYEPSERIRIQKGSPEPRKSIYSIRKCDIRNSEISDELAIDEITIPFNKNLVGVTGGKGSGKTALLDLMANCFEDRCSRAGLDPNSFVQRIEDQKDDLIVSIEFISRSINPFSKEIKTQQYFQDSLVTYLPQGKIEEFSGDRKKLDAKIQEIIFSNKAIIEGGFKERFDILQNEISELNGLLRGKNSEIFSLELDTSPKIYGEIQANIKLKEGELTNKQEELKDFTKDLKVDIAKSVGQLKENEAAARMKHSKLDQLKGNIAGFKKALNEDISSHNETISNLNRNIKIVGIAVEIPQISIKQQVAKLDEVRRALVSMISTLHDQIINIESRLKLLSGTASQHAQLLKVIEDIKTEKSSFNRRLTTLNKKKDKIAELEGERNNLYMKFLLKFWEWKGYYDKVISTFSEGKSKIMEGVEFESNIFFDLDRFVEIGLDNMDLRRVNREDITLLADKISSLITHDTGPITEENVENMINSFYAKKPFLKGTRNSNDFYEWVFGNYYLLSTKILFIGTEMDKLSMGQKGTALLKLFLSEGEHPLIIDQPEESLDNKFIYDELVEAFREAKKKRQIILATNNANLIVNTDAEQIIIAEYENNRISYRLGALENPEIRDELMPILEGGEEAFRKREMKYGI